jgi:hypothetical protein
MRAVDLLISPPEFVVLLRAETPIPSIAIFEAAASAYGAEPHGPRAVTR